MTWVPSGRRCRWPWTSTGGSATRSRPSRSGRGAVGTRGRTPTPSPGRCWCCASSPTRRAAASSRAHDVAARGRRRRAQLGLPLLLAAGRLADPRGAARRRLRRRDPALARLAGARRWRATRPTCRSCTPSTAAGTSPNGSSATYRGMPGRARCGSATGGRPAPERRPGRGDDRPGCRAPARSRGDTPVVGGAAGPRRRAGRPLGRARPRPVGDPGPMRHFTHSRVMVWAALDRAVRAVEQGGHDGPLERWRAVRDEVRAEVLEKGFDISGAPSPSTTTPPRSTRRCC